MKKYFAFTFAFVFFLSILFCCETPAKAESNVLHSCCELSQKAQQHNAISGISVLKASFSKADQCVCKTTVSMESNEKIQDLGLLSLNFSKTFSLSLHSFAEMKLASAVIAFYKSPPRVTQNSTPLYLQHSILRI